MSTTTDGRHDRGYEWRTVALLSLGFGLVGLDRFMILPLFPVIRRELGLGFGDIGLITGALAFTWGVSALLFGRLSDRLGRRRVLVGSMIAFSVLVGVSGLAEGMASLVLLRALMGFAEGAFVTPAIAATLEAAHPRRRGLALGLQQMANPLFGLALAPLFVMAMMEVVDWRWVFATVALPGFIVAWLLARTLRESPERAGASEAVAQEPLLALLRRRNLRLAMLSMVAALNALVVIGALLPSYLLDVLRLPGSTVGWVLSANGVGAVVGGIVMPGLSDKIGRRAALLIAALTAAAGFWALAGTGAAPALLAAELFVASFGVFAIITLVVGPIAAEAVPNGMAASASGLVILTGEVFGGGIAPVIAGYLVETAGLQAIFPMALAGMGLAVIAALALRETRGAPAAQELMPLV